MKLEEMRGWMEEGCPVEEVTAVAVPEVVEQVSVPEPEPEVSMPCRSFHLGVIPSHGVLIARCKDCGVEMEHGEIMLVDTGLEEKVAQGDWDALRGLCRQMEAHGKGSGEVGYMLMGKPGSNPWQAIEAWIHELMLHDGGSGTPGDFEQSGWRFSFNRSLLWYEAVPEPKRPGFVARMLNRLGLGGGPR